MRCPCQTCPPRARPSLAAGVGTTGAGAVLGQPPCTDHGPPERADAGQNDPASTQNMDNHSIYSEQGRGQGRGASRQGVRRPGRRGCLGAQNGLGETGGFSRTDLRAAASWSHQTLSRHRVSLHTLQMMYVTRWNASWVILPGPSPGSTGVTGPLPPVFGQRPPCTNHPKEPMQPSKTLPQHRTPTK